ncbi:hypothetical protein [Streptomyces sp. RFCAC02]|nr:hypothetical protein [Streptomyces sp. RFCAC02]
MRESPPAGPDAFTDAVLTAEDLDPAAEPELRARVLAVVTRHMREW